jgi:hypothetical protein
MMHLVLNNPTKTYLPLFGLAISLVVQLLPVLSAQAQKIDDFDSLLADYATLDSLLLAELENDSSSILSILEEIMDENYIKSQLSVRMGYTSNITNAGRNFGIQQYGLNTGLAFYHKSGLFADLSGYYNSDLDPKFNTLITSVGYMGVFGPRWNYYLSYDHFFYGKPKEIDYVINYPLTNSLNASTNFLINKFNIGVDYSFLFGDETSHRGRLNLSYYLSFKKVGFIDRINFSPNLSMLTGNANVTAIVFNQEMAKENSKLLIQKIGWRQFRYLLNNDRGLLKLLLSEEQTSNSFGIMNYSIFIPVSFNIKKTTLLLNYSLNFPIALPGETNFDTTPNSYFSATLLYTFSL